ncbi:hypothetical protein, partial [Fusobacterium nucleatum]|uniref:hypothetical protein n=1 Tax=Fusobacterium nucleatum TaxID=851 RepID=UPI00195750A0
MKINNLWGYYNIPSFYSQKNFLNHVNCKSKLFYQPYLTNNHNHKPPLQVVVCSMPKRHYYKLEAKA